jgi:hypothetical protein
LSVFLVRFFRAPLKGLKPRFWFAVRRFSHTSSGRMPITTPSDAATGILYQSGNIWCRLKTKK